MTIPLPSSQSQCRQIGAGLSSTQKATRSPQYELIIPHDAIRGLFSFDTHTLVSPIIDFHRPSHRLGISERGSDKTIPRLGTSGTSLSILERLVGCRSRRDKINKPTYRVGPFVFTSHVRNNKAATTLESYNTQTIL